jgi:GntR family transcriptional repressor for pyruvate dehydrogenase complex
MGFSCAIVSDGLTNVNTIFFLFHPAATGRDNGFIAAAPRSPTMTTIEKTRREKTNFKARPVHKTSISDDIVQQIMKQISTGALQPGQRLPSERDLCKRFDTGRSSVREALRCLSIMGVLTARVGEGTSVAIDGGKFLETVMEWCFITVKYDIKNLMELRIAIESLAAASSAERATQEDIEGLENLIAGMETAVGDPKRFGALDLEFHLSIARSSQNQVIFDLVSLIRGQLARALATVLVLPQARPRSVEEHQAILKAVKRRSPVAARKAMQAHLEAAIKRYDSSQTPTR